MDFSLTEEQEAAVGLVRTILEDRGTPERLTEVEAGEERFDRDTWAELAKADLLGLSLPESVGGGGFGFLEVCLVLQEQGRAVTPIPLWPCLSAALAIARFGTDDEQAAWLRGVVAGETILTTALGEATTNDPLAPTTTATASGGWVLRGAKTAVPYAHVADAVVLAATIVGTGEVGLFVVPLDTPGLSQERQDTFSHEPTSHLEFDGVTLGEDALFAHGREAVQWLVDRATVAVCAVAAGVADKGLRITAEYATNRHQFERPIATFQAVGQRMADGFIDAEAIRLTMLQAATCLEAEADATAEVAVAKYWASQGGSRVGHTGLHVHGGISIDLDYAIHRYFLWSKQLELTLGSGAEHLSRVGTYLADVPASVD